MPALEVVEHRAHRRAFAEDLVLTLGERAEGSGNPDLDRHDDS
jgi:hypothetical protein